MSEAKARQLLQRVVDYLSGRGVSPSGAELIGDCRAYLAAVPAPPAEPSIDAIDECIGLVAGELHDEGRARAAWDQLRALIAAPAAEPVAQPRNSSLPATAEDKTIYDRIAANYAAPVAQQPLRDIVFDGPDDPHRLPAPQPEAPVAQQPPPRDVEADARRYRWLRLNGGRYSTEYGSVDLFGELGEGEIDSDALDAAIDAEMSAASPTDAANRSA